MPNSVGESANKRLNTMPTTLPAMACTKKSPGPWQPDVLAARRPNSHHTHTPSHPSQPLPPHSLTPPPRLLPSNLQPIPLRPLLSLQLLSIHLLRPNSRELKRLAPPPLQPPPNPNRLPIRPRQRAHPRLHIPAQLERDIGAVLQPARNIRDLVFGFLRREMQFARGVGGRGFLFGSGLCFFALGGEFFARDGVRVVVLVPGG